MWADSCRMMLVATIEENEGHRLINHPVDNYVFQAHLLRIFRDF